MNAGVRLRLLQQGTTLIELVVAITIISIAVLSVMSLFATAATQSGQALINAEATAIASAYIEEITSKPFADPDGVGGETLRQNYDDVDDYKNLSAGPAQNSEGVALTGLSPFIVAVSITNVALGAVPSSQARLIDVTVTHNSGARVTLSAYRAAP